MSKMSKRQRVEERIADLERAWIDIQHRLDLHGSLLGEAEREGMIRVQREAEREIAKQNRWLDEDSRRNSLRG